MAFFLNSLREGVRGSLLSNPHINMTKSIEGNLSRQPSAATTEQNLKVTFPLYSSAYRDKVRPMPTKANSCFT